MPMLNPMIGEATTAAPDKPDKPPRLAYCRRRRYSENVSRSRQSCPDFAGSAAPCEENDDHCLRQKGLAVVWFEMQCRQRQRLAKQAAPWLSAVRHDSRDWRRSFD